METERSNETPVRPANAASRTDPGAGRWLIGCAVMFFLFVISLVVAAVYYISKVDSVFPPKLMVAPGVKMENELDRATLEFVRKNRLMEPDEQLVLYYDLWQNREEVCILTNRRAVYWKKGRMVAIPLNRVKEIKTYKRDNFPESTEVFVIVGEDGRRMKVEIFELDGVRVFERELKDAIHAAKKGGSH